MSVTTDTALVKMGFRKGVVINTNNRVTGNVIDMHQFIEAKNCYDLHTSNTVVSFWAKSSVAGSVQVYLGASQDGTSTMQKSNQTVSLTTSWQYFSLQFPALLSSPSTGGLTDYGINLFFQGYRWHAKRSFQLLYWYPTRKRNNCNTI